MLEKSDLIVVFRGRMQRIPTGFQLARDGFAPNLVISPATKLYIKRISKKYKQPESVAIIIEDQARTTFENALYTKKIIDRHGFESLIVVTDWYHMPRSCLMLKLLLSGTGIQVHTYQTTTAHLHAGNWHRYTVGWKLVYNEMMEVFGSLLEWARYRLTGRLPEIQVGISSFIVNLKRFILFEVDIQLFEKKQILQRQLING